MKTKFLISAAAVSLLAFGATARADEAPYTGFQGGDVLVRLRGLDVLPDVSSSVSKIDGSVHAANNVVPELDGTYFFTPNLSAELIAAVTYHTVKDVNSAAGTVPLGSVRLLPPTLTAQWHFLPQGMINPYVGAGINYTFFYGVKGGSPIVYSTHYSDGVGAALQAGADVHLTGNWYFNVDVKKLFLESDVTLGTAVGQIKAKVNLDPWLFGAGFGYKF